MSPNRFLSLKKALIFALTFCLFQGVASSAKMDILDGLSEDLLSAVDPSFSNKQTTEDIRALTFNPRDAIGDPFDRISKDFKIPDILKRRVGFWFDIYTKYGSNHHVIHHSRYPWIVFEVVDTTDINNNKKLHKWTRYHRAKALVKSRRKAVYRSLRSLSKKRSFKRLSGLDKKLYNKMIGLRGKRRTVFKKAAAAMRTQLGQKEFILDGLHYSPRYLPYMEEIFKSKGLPTELTRIPFVESSFNPHAVSKVGASGIWQIMPRVGKSYFKVGKYIDERNSPLKASLAAAELMKFNYNYLKDWGLAVTAYNHGAYGVKKSLKKSKSKNIIQLISRHRGGAFKFASSNFYASFLAVLHAEKYQKEIFKHELKDQEKPLRYSIYTLAKTMRPKKLIKMLGIDKDTFVNFNLDLKNAVKKNARLPKNHRFLVPFERQLDLEGKHHLGIRPVRTAVSLKGLKKAI